MNLNQVTLPATNVERSVDFYRTMGFTQIVSNLPSYARFECSDGGATFSLHHVDSVVAQPGVVVYFECADLDATYSELVERGIQFDSSPTDQRWLWREARLHDPDGNVLCLFHAGENRRNPPWRLRQDATQK
jgi:predicted enzyme related to lactoylglutathione lyase